MRHEAKAPQLDRAIEWLRKISVLGSLGAAAGFGLVFFLGAGIYSAYQIAYGIPLFTFSVTHCLEYGGMFISEILVNYPLMLVSGVERYLLHAEEEVAYHILFGAPLVLWVLTRLLGRLERTRGGIFHAGFASANVL
jgi:hypothetical protein